MIGQPGDCRNILPHLLRYSLKLVPMSHLQGKSVNKFQVWLESSTPFWPFWLFEFLLLVNKMLIEKLLLLNTLVLSELAMAGTGYVFTLHYCRAHPIILIAEPGSSFSKLWCKTLVRYLPCQQGHQMRKITLEILEDLTRTEKILEDLRRYYRIF